MQYGKVWITYIKDCDENEDGYFCEVYADEDYSERIDYFCIHPEDCDCTNEDEVEKFIEEYSKMYQGDNSIKDTKMVVTFSRYENDILISEAYPDGSVVGECVIINTSLGFQLRAYHDSWKIFGKCNNLFELLGGQSMSGITMEMLAGMIEDIGYELRVI